MSPSINIVFINNESIMFNHVCFHVSILVLSASCVTLLNSLTLSLFVNMKISSLNFIVLVVIEFIRLGPNENPVRMR
jgi:hypothetical protein